MSHATNDESAALLDVRGLAARLNLTPGAVYMMHHRGQIPGVIKIKRRLRFDAAAIRKWIDEQRLDSGNGSAA